MNPWIVLGIKETGDKKKVKEKYMSLLSKFNPEDDPDGFKELRAAYELALKQIGEKSKKKPTDPVNVFMDKFENLYKDFVKRIDVSNWQELLQDDICTNLETEDEISRSILDFLMEHHHLPKSVWQLFDSKFHWTAMEKELSKSIHPGFISFVISNINSVVSTDYDLFDTSEDKDFDRFLFLLNEVQGRIENRMLDDLEVLMYEIEILGIDHPDYELEKIRYTALKKDPAKALKMLENLMKNRYNSDYSNNLRALYVKAYVLLMFKGDEEKLNQSVELTKTFLKSLPSHYFAQINVFEAYELLGKHEEAYEFILNESLPYYPSNAYILSYAARCIGSLKEKYAKMYAENPNDYDISITYVKYCSYLQKFKEAGDVLSKLKDKSKAEYFARLSEVRSGTGNYPGAIEAAYKAVELEPSYSHYYLLIYPLLELERYDEAIAQADIALSQSFSETGFNIVGKSRLFRQKGYAQFKLEKYDEALESLNKAIETHDKVSDNYAAIAEVYKKTGNYNEAAYCAEMSIELLPYVPLPYEILAEIYCETDNYDQLDDILERAASLKIQSHGFSFFKAQALSSQQKFDEALKILKKLMKKEDLGSWKEKITNELTYIYETSDDYKNAALIWRKYIKENPADEVGYNRLAMSLENLGEDAKALDTVKKGLKKIPDSTNLRIRKGFILLNSKKGAEALEEFLYAIDHMGPGVWWDAADLYEEIGKIYYSSLNDAENALKYCKLTLEHTADGKNAEMNFFIGDMYLYYYNDTDEAIKHYNAALKADEVDFYSYYSRACAYKRQGKHDLAEADFKKVIELCSKKPITYHGLHRYIGQAQIGLGNLAAAKEALDKALEMQGTDGTGYKKCYCVFQGYALYHAARNKYKEALENIDIAIGLTNSVKNNAIKKEILAHL